VRMSCAMTTDRAIRSASQAVRLLARATLLAAIPGVLLICGCGGPGAREAITGTVTFDGKPLDKGEITLIPQTNTKGPTAGAEIVGGKFTIPAAGGTFAGKFRVEITASRPTGRKGIDRLTGTPMSGSEQYIPSRYNTESQLTADVKAGAENRLEFAVNSK
jgi:hypothetical protein